MGDLLDVERLRASEPVQRLRERQAERGKLSKFQAYFVAEAMMEAARCENCVWWISPEASATGQGACAVVASEGDPLPGEVAAESTCNLWNASPVRIAAVSAARGRGDRPGILPGNLRVRVEQVFIPSPRTEPPDDVADNLLVEDLSLSSLLEG